MKANPLVTKTFAILVIVGLLTLALGRIGSLADERQQRFCEAEASVQQSQAGRQALLGPVLHSAPTRGFSATWQVSSLATTAPLDFERGAALCASEGAEGKCIEAFNVSFIDPVNPYSLSDRAIKYGLLFIVLKPRSSSARC